MTASGNTLRNAVLRSLTVDEQRAIQGGGFLSGLTNAIKGVARPVLLSASSVLKKDNDTHSGIIGKI